MSNLAETVALLAAAFPRQDFPEVSVRIYMRALSDLPADEVRHAVDHLINRVDWLPSIAAIRREVAERRLELPSTMKAWELVQTTDGRKQAPPPVLAALQAIGGPYSLRTTDRPDVKHAQFRRAYEDIREAELRAIAEARDGSLMIGSQPRGELEA